MGFAKKQIIYLKIHETRIVGLSFHLLEIAVNVEAREPENFPSRQIWRNERLRVNVQKTLNQSCGELFVSVL